MFLVKVFAALALVSVVRSQCARSDDKFIGDLCYTISNQKLSFSDAQSACYGSNSNLAVIHTSLQSNFLASLVRSQTGAPEGKFWIGLSRASSGSRFQWDDGTTMYWSNFDASFPKDNNYVAESTINGKWQTLDGTKPLFYVCSYDPANPGTAQPSTPGNGGSTGYPASVPMTGGTDQTFMPSYATGYPMSQGTGSPVSDSTGYPMSYGTGVPVSDSTGYPMSYGTGQPASDSTGYPISYGTGSPASDSTGYPMSYGTGVPVSDSTGYPMSQGTGFPVSDSTGYPGSSGTGIPVSGYPGSDSTGYPVSYGTGPSFSA